MTWTKKEHWDQFNNFIKQREMGIIPEQKKYYTPSIEEFHVGFEYEMKVRKAMPEPVDSKWIKVIFTPTDSCADFCNTTYERGGTIKYSLAQDVLRVKYLGKEDIEELGWEFINKSSGKFLGTENSYQFKKTKVINEIKYMTWGLTVDFNSNPRIVVIYQYIPTPEGENVDVLHFFTINLKNKSELKKLMQQLNIE